MRPGIGGRKIDNCFYFLEAIRVIAESSDRHVSFIPSHHPQVVIDSASLGASVPSAVKQGAVIAHLSCGRREGLRMTRNSVEMMQATHLPQGLADIKCSTEVSLMA